MKKTFLGLSLLASVCASAQQQYVGYRSGNYTGVNGVFFNPANIADSRYRWDVNLFGVNAGLGNNKASFKLKNIADAFSSSADSLLFGSDGKKTNALANVDVFGPSFMFNASHKVSFALTTRFRTIANIRDFDGKLIDAIDNASNSTLPTSFSSAANQKLAVNGWSDFGASVGIILKEEGAHFLKGGLTVKYLAGVANSYANINNLQGTLNEDGFNKEYFSNTTGTLALGYSGEDLNNFDINNGVKFHGTGVGADLGFVYEYRPDGTKTEKSQNKYKFKIGLALLDIGSIKFTPKANEFGNYTLDITGSEKWYPEDLNGKSVSEIKTYLDSKPTLFTNNLANQTTYKSQLPTTLQVNADWSLNSGFFVDIAGQLSLAKKANVYSPFYNNEFTVTPRYEGKAFGFYLPINYNSLTQLNAGVSLRAGPLFVGSGSVLTALVGKSKQADVHFGVRFGSLQKKAKKVKEQAAIVQDVVEAVKQAVDSDGDGINDELDKCPTVAGVAKYNGCPIPDTDNDGINDEDDKCPNVAGVAKYNGCPVPDADNDGINDEEDKCPNVAGFVRYQGCPIPDSDNDGINDEADKCPTIPGTVENNGCPEIKKDVVKKVEKAASRILFVTGKAVLQNASLNQLNEVVKVLNEDASLKITIDGHTDNVGDDAKNLILSQSRAAAVQAYLVKKGIDESRISSKGFGETMPIADNSTNAGRSQNRRVELKLNY